MSSDFDERLDRAIAKHLEKADQEAETLRLQGIVKKELEQRQTTFLTDFAIASRAVILPALERANEKLERAGQAGTRSDATVEHWRVAKADVSDSDGQLGLHVSRPSAGTAHLSFRVDRQLLKVVVQSNFGAISPQELDLQQVTRTNIDALVAGFIELALSH
jgi:hypothetical protein